jgi:hypothetical protein
MRDLRRRCVTSERAGLFTHIDPHENGAIPVSASQRQSRMFSEIHRREAGGATRSGAAEVTIGRILRTANAR